MTNAAKKPRHERIEALDVIRGILILGMICDHLLYDCVSYLDVPYWFFQNPIRMTVHYVGSYLFILLSGSSSSVSRSNWRRGLELAAVAAGVTLVTWIGDHDAFIVFGILHCLAACTLLYALLRPLLDRIPRSIQPWLWVALTMLSWILTDFISTDVPGLWIFGFPTASFFSADYFPLLPWIFVYFLGALAGPIIFGYGLPAWFYRIRCAWLSYIGRHSLLIYLAHQPVILAVILVIADRL